MEKKNKDAVKILPALHSLEVYIYIGNYTIYTYIWIILKILIYIFELPIMEK